MKEFAYKKVALVMGSKSDWATMKHCADFLDNFKIKHHRQVVSAHRTPDLLSDFAKNAQKNGIQIIIAAAGGAAHLPGMIAAFTPLPVIGVPIKSSTLNGIDSLLSIVQMPAGVPVATMSIGEAGAKNAAIYCASILANNDDNVKHALEQFRTQQSQDVINNSDLNL